jgi:hypothetical protein
MRPCPPCQPLGTDVPRRYLRLIRVGPRLPPSHDRSIMITRAERLVALLGGTRASPCPAPQRQHAPPRLHSAHACHDPGHNHRADGNEPGHEAEDDTERSAQPAAGDDRRGKQTEENNSRPIQNSAVRMAHELKVLLPGPVAENRWRPPTPRSGQVQPHLARVGSWAPAGGCPRVTRNGWHCRVGCPATGRSRARRRFPGRGRPAGTGAAAPRAAGGSGPCCGGCTGPGRRGRR